MRYARHALWACLVLAAACQHAAAAADTSTTKCLHVGSSAPTATEHFSFTIQQAVEGTEGRIAVVKDAASHTPKRPFARLTGTLALVPVCAASGESGGAVMEGRVRINTVFCDETRTPDVELSECATLWNPLSNPLSGAATQLTAPFWFTRNATGHIDVKEAVLAEPNAAASADVATIHHEIREAIIAEMSVPTLCHVGPDDVFDIAAAPSRRSYIDWSSRHMEVETSAKKGEIVLTDRTFHADALGHMINTRHTAQARMREGRSLVISLPEVGSKVGLVRGKYWPGALEHV